MTQTADKARLYRSWVLYLVLPVPWGRPLTALLLAALLLPLFQLGSSDHVPADTPAVFFSLIIAYSIPMLSYITERAQQALAELQPLVNLEETDRQAFHDRLQGSPLVSVLGQLVGGALAGLIHISALTGSIQAVFHGALQNRESLVSTVGTVLVWIVMTSMLWLLVQQAAVFARFGARVRISLLNTQPLLPFARFSVASSLAIIGALALFPLMGVDSQLDSGRVLPGAIATLVPLILLFIIPVWPVHRRLLTLKTAELARLDAALDTGGERLPAPGSAELQPVVTLLVARREIAQVKTWPFDAGVVTRLLMYLVIVPLTWAGAALIERLVDSVL